MSKLEEMIERLCPDGVEFKQLWEVTIWDKKFQGVEKHKQPKTIRYNVLLANELNDLRDENGSIRLLYTGSGDEHFTTEEKAGNNICQGEIVAIPWGGTPRVQYYNGKFVTGDNRIATSIDVSFIDNKFIYYWLSNKIDELSGYYRGSGIQHPSMKSVLDMKLPIPPLEMQQEIVRILDTFTSLEAELEAELEARKKQYDYYRDNLLTNGDNVEFKKIKEVYKRLKGTPITAEKMKQIENLDGDVRIFAGGKTVINAFEKDVPNANITRVPAVLIQSRGVIDAIYYNRPFTFKNEMWAYTSENQTSVKYLYYALKNDIQYFRDAASGMGSLPQISLKVTEEFLIPVPSLEKQARIVDILERFDTLVNDLSQGLPAEIATRRKQYEYYRNKLLTFKEVKHESV